MNRQKPPLLQIIICDQDICPTNKLPVWFPQRKRHKVSVWIHQCTLACCRCDNVVQMWYAFAVLSQSRHWRKMLSPKIPSKVTSPQTAANSLSNDHSAQILHILISTSVGQWRSTSQEHTSDMTKKWQLRCTDQIFLFCRNQTWCIAVSLWQISGAKNIVFNSWFTVSSLLEMELSITWPSSPQPIQEAPYRDLCSGINISVISLDVI